MSVNETQIRFRVGHRNYRQFAGGTFIILEAGSLGAHVEMALGIGSGYERYRLAATVNTSFLLSSYLCTAAVASRKPAKGI